MDGVQLPQGCRATTRNALCATKFPYIPGAYLVDLRRMKGRPVVLRMALLCSESSMMGIQCLYLTEPLIFSMSCQTGTDEKTNKNKNQLCF